MTLERHYMVILTPVPGTCGFCVSVPAFPEIATQGDSVEEAIANAREAILLVVIDQESRGEEIPPNDSDARVECVAITVDHDGPAPPERPQVPRSGSRVDRLQEGWRAPK